VRFTLLSAGTALAASLMLAACSSNGANSIPSGSQVGAPMGHGVGNYRLVSVARHDTTCPTAYVQCLAVAPGSSAEAEWCISDSGNCTSGLYAGKIVWKAGKVGPGKHLKAKFAPGKGNPSDLTVTASSKAASCDGTVCDSFTWTASLKSGSYKGTTFTEDEGVAVL
jgi:hypothetical protein